MSESLRKYYGDQLTMEYLDVVDDDLEQYPEVESYLKAAGMTLPLLLINGKIIRPGTGLNYREIEEFIEEFGLRKKD